jgi:F-type H+-transporting ATPase subunit epsilon
MDSYILQIITPQKKYAEMPVQSIALNTHFGQISIYAHHEDMIANIEISPLVIRTASGVLEHFAVGGGVLNVIQDKNIVQLLLTSVESYDEIDVQRAIESKLEAEKLLVNAKSVQEYNAAEIELKKALNRLSVKNQYKPL